MVIRDARPEEYDRVSDLIEAAYDEYGPSPEDSDVLLKAFEEYKLDQRDVRSRLKDSVLIVAEAEGKLVGTVTYYPPRPEGTGEGWPPGWAAIRLLGVVPSARGLGVGRALTEESLRRAREAGAVALGLHTTKLMETARAMYERMGFTRYPSNDIPISDDFVVVGYSLPL